MNPYLLSLAWAYSSVAYIVIAYKRDSNEKQVRQAWACVDEESAMSRFRDAQYDRAGWSFIEVIDRAQSTPSGEPLTTKCWERPG